MQADILEIIIIPTWGAGIHTGKSITFEEVKLFREMFVACKDKPMLPNTFTVSEGNKYGLLKNII